MSLTESVIAHGAVGALYLALTAAAIFLSRQTKYAGLTAAFLAFGLVFLMGQMQDGAIGSSFVLGSLCGLCTGIGGTLAFAGLVRRKRQNGGFSSPDARGSARELGLPSRAADG